MSETEIMVLVNDVVSPSADAAVNDGPVGIRNVASNPPDSMPLIQRLFSFPAMLGMLLVAGMATIARTFFIDPDVWWHIKFGQVILATHRLPTNDIYSFSAGGWPWIDAEWAAEVLLAAAYRLDGVRGLEILLLVLGSAILASLYLLATIRCGNSKAGFLTAAAVFLLATPSFNLRPQMIGYLFLVLTLIALERFRQGHRRVVWLLPILMIVWINAHPSWSIALGFIGVYLASGLVELRIGDVESRPWGHSGRLQLTAVLLLCGFATLITPYGARLAKFPFEFTSKLPVSLGNIKEWLPMPFGDPLGKLFLLALFSVIVLQLTGCLKWRLEDIVLFIFATAVACLHRRFIMIFVPILTLVLANALARWVPRYERAKDQFVINAALMAIILAIIVWYFPTQKELWEVVAKDYPVAATAYLNDHAVPGPMFNTYDFGGYLVLARGPEHKVFLDGRSELYEPAGLLADYFEIANVKPGMFPTLQKYGFQSCLLHRDEALATVLAASPDWQTTYEDDTSILFVKRSISDPVAKDDTSGSLGSSHYVE